MKTATTSGFYCLPPSALPRRATKLAIQTNLIKNLDFSVAAVGGMELSSRFDQPAHHTPSGGSLLVYRFLSHKNSYEWRLSFQPPGLVRVPPFLYSNNPKYLCTRAGQVGVIRQKGLKSRGNECNTSMDLILENCFTSHSKCPIRSV